MLYCLFSCFPSAPPWGVLSTPKGENLNCPHNRGIPVKSLVFLLNSTVNGSDHSCMYQLCQYQLLALLYTCMSSNWYFTLLFPGLPPLMTSWEHPYDISKHWYQQQYLFVYLIYLLFWNFFPFSYMHQCFLLVGQVNFKLFKTIVAIPMDNML